MRMAMDFLTLSFLSKDIVEKNINQMNNFCISVVKICSKLKINIKTYNKNTNNIKSVRKQLSQII